MGHKKYSIEQVNAAHKKWQRGKATESIGNNNPPDNEPYFVDPKTGANLKAKQSVIIKFDKSTSEKETLVEGGDVAYGADEIATPIASCSFVFRYHKNGGKGALKYDPVECTDVVDFDKCQELKQKRGGHSITFNFFPMIAPGCGQYSRKALTVPSVGCPYLLANKSFVEKLLWAKEAKNRPTFLIVHSSEAYQYEVCLGDTLESFGVGLVAWLCREPVLGFGVSRLAAQQFGEICGRSDVVLCDVNVIWSKNVASGYETGNEEKYPVKSTFRYTGAGSGTGVPLYKFDKEKSALIPTKAAKGGKGRPIEQVVTVGDELLYDPCFITSSEDADLTASFLFEEYLARNSKGRRPIATTFKLKPFIEKVNIESGGFGSKKYANLRDLYLETLSHEDEVLITYKEKGKSRNVTVGTLAEQIAKQHGLSKIVIRSLIVEKILLCYKSKLLNKQFNL